MRALGARRRLRALARARAGRARPALDGIDADAASAIVAEALAGGGGWLVPDRVAALLARYGVAHVQSRIAATPAAVGRCAAELGGPVAIKAIAPGLVHKADVGGVRLDLETPAAATRAAREISASIRAAGHVPAGFVVQAMAPAGVEILVGAVGDPDFGPVVACAAGGGRSSCWATSRRASPRSRAPMRPRCSRSLRTYPLLNGYRGAPPADVPALEDVVAARRRARRRAPGDRRARLQPGDRVAVGRARGRCARADRVAAPAAALSVARSLAVDVDEPVLERVANELGARRLARLLLDVRAVGLDRADATGTAVRRSRSSCARARSA